MKYYNCLLALPIVCLLSGTISAQAPNFIGVKGGLSIPNLTSGSNNQNPLSNGFSSRTGPDFGIFGEHFFNNWFSLQFEVDYSAQGGKHNGLQAITDPFGSNPPYFYANFKNQARLNYLLLPILAKGTLPLAEKWEFFMDAGVFAGFLLSAKIVSSGMSPIYADPKGQEEVDSNAVNFDNTQNIKSSIHSFNLGFAGSVGFAYMCGHGKIFIEAGGNYGFINIQKYAADGTNYTGAATIHIGYQMAIICKKKKT
ncbi:MAG TPA: outer membrane beta-barrel protein [Puia sp.]|nr:outer membrane beta-barrel protein [Puia sp.]